MARSLAPLAPLAFALTVLFWPLGCTAGQAKPEAAVNTAQPVGTEVATFAGGCFWCMEPPFAGLTGVLDVTVGYTGGHTVHPTYEQVSAGGTGHAESVQVRFDPHKITYKALLDIFWHQIDPTTPDAQFCDHGTQYRSAIFYHDATQKRLAEASRDQMAKSGRFKGKIVTQIVPATAFYRAEDYHQGYYKKNPIRYHYYRYRCGRDDYLDQIWGKDRKRAD